MLVVASMCNMVGIFSIFFLGSVTTWRNAALVGLACPLIMVFVLFFVCEIISNLIIIKYLNKNILLDSRITTMASVQKTIRRG